MSTFLAEEYIPVTFDVLKKNVTSDRVRELTNYLDQRNHLDTNNVDCISNGCEDKQRRRGKAPPHQESPEVLPSILVLLNLLHKETTSIPIQLKMISEGKLRRYQRKTTRLLQCRINQLWDSYNDGSTSLDILLMECGQIYNGQ